MTTPIDSRPGLNARRLVRLMGAAIDRCRLDLSDQTVLTEAATGAYVVTAVMAAMAGAEVYALSAATSYAASEDLERATHELAHLAGVTTKVQLVRQKHARFVGAADIITNSGQVRPIDADLIGQMRESAVVPLMYESWEYRPEDLDLQACRVRNIPVAGTNERHPSVDVFSFLGPMAVKQLHDAGVAVLGSRIVLICDNPFGPFIASGLRAGGAEVTEVEEWRDGTLQADCDAVMSALHPRAAFTLTAAHAETLVKAAPGAVLVEFWGDTDRAAFLAAGVPVWPPRPSRPGHMAILPSAIGPEPIVRLQAGGLKVGEVLSRGLHRASPYERSFLQLL